jgi:rubrerythrin
MKKMTEGNVQAAFAGESQAHMRYLTFAAKAREEGFPNVARLFEAISWAEQAHASRHLRNLGGVGTTADNLTTAIGGETFEVDEMYPAYMEVAKLQGEKLALVGMDYAFQAEQIHAAMYTSARQAVQAQKDVTLGTIQICSSCGYTVEGEAPDRCPICGVPKNQFRAF